MKRWGDPNDNGDPVEIQQSSSKSAKRLEQKGPFFSKEDKAP